MAAESSPPSPSEIQEPPASLELSAAEASEFVPNQQEITQGIKAVEREEEAHEEELEKPAAVQEREKSREAFTELNPTESKELLVNAFPEQLELLNTDPARFLSEAKIIRPIGDDAAVVSQEGDTSLLEAGIPVRTEDEEGQLSKVDLSLVEGEGGFEADNPLVDVRIPDSAAAPIEVGSEGLGISLAGATGAAQPLGEQNAFYPDAQSDSDLLVSPVSSGVELFDQLRSPQSPETLRFQIALPEGAALRADGSGGAEIVEGDEAFASIPFPSAVDAQGAEVPVHLHVENDAVVLDVAHREGEFAYPILVDPILEDWINSGTSWYNGHSYQALENGAWQWTSEPYGQMYIGTSCFYTCWGSGRGLYVTAPSRTYGSEVHAHWAYLAPNLGSFVKQVSLNPFWRDDHGCSQTLYPQPHDYDGFWGDNQWNLLQTNQAINVGSVAVESWGRSFIVGLSSAGGANLPCWRDLMVGGAAVWLDDWEYPPQPNVTGMPTGWLKKGSTQTINVEASDPGLGVQEVRLTSPGEKHWPWTQPWCSGLYENRCPASRSGQLPFNTESFMEGNVPVSVNTVSPSGKVSPPRSYELKIDGTAPGITMSGQFVTATAPEGVDQLSLPVYNLSIKAKDLLSTGGTGSGVKKVKVFLDGKEVASKGPTCTSSSCPGEYEWTYPVILTGLTEEEHHLEVRATDFVGNETLEKTWLKNFKYIPATGMKEEYVLQHFLLPDGKNHEGEEYEGPELAVNVMNGNVVYRERDLKATSQRGSSLDLERIYNSQQPVARDGQWGHGWSLAQTPEFKPEAAEATSAKMLRTSAVTSAVSLPKTTGETTFSSRLHATVAKTRSGGYEVRSASEEGTQVFSSAGRIEEERLSSVSPEVTVQPEPLFPVYAESIGSPGSGNGQLTNPADVAVDAAGNTWVVDKGNNRIEEFNEAGEFIREAGGLGSTGGKLSSPSGIAIDSAGNLDVTDTANNRISQFSSTGAFIEVIGANVNKTKVEAGGTTLEKNRCTAASGNTCQAGSAGTGEGQIAEPIGITTTGGTNFFVVERANNRVEKFNPQAELLAKFGSLGSENGQLKEPTAIAFHGFLLWVADTGNERMEAFTTSYAYSRKFGGAGSGNGPLGKPVGVETDASGNVWVAEQANNRLQEFSQTGDYITQFGEGGQFAFNSPAGVFLDPAGDLWVTDSQRGQVQEWMTGESLFAGSLIGSSGTGNGQFSHPADLSLDGKGNLWALDKGNNRLEKFNEKGEYVTSVGAKGGAAGQLNAPSALAIDAGGNLWVADTANNRIEEWSEAGQFILTFGREVNKTKVETPGSTEAEKNLCTAASGNVCQAGVAGSTNGQLNAPKGIAFTSSGTIWVTDTGNSRLEKFSTSGGLISTLSGEGSEPGKLKEPTAITVAPDGSKWVADTGNNRIEQWNVNNSFVGAVGKEGTGNGEFKAPVAIEADSAGNIWVADQNNNRIQQFTSGGEYVAQLGSSPRFAFSGPMGLAADGKGGLWVTDSGHNRLQRLLTSEFAKPLATQVPAIAYTYSGSALAEMKLKEPEAPDPAITLATTSGLATSASSEAATATYSYSEGNLTAKSGSEGETKYERDPFTNRITKITLPNGTWAKVAYDEIGRATEVTVKPAGGTEKTTKFKYQINPRVTYVWGTANPEVIYYFGEDGSLLKWENAATPPIFESIGGSLWSSRDSTTPVENKDQYLYVTATSQNEIASIKVLSGNAVLAEQTCEDKSEPPAHNCDRPEPLEWITNPSEHTPGRLDLEIVATDFQGHSVAERFFVTIPQQPPVDPEADVPPDFASTKKFREDYGLDRAHPLSRSELNRLVLELLYEWEAQVPTAVAAVEQWGVPLRGPELTEMESRREYIDRASEVIPQWAEEHAPTTYAGFYVDDRAGGVIYVGFTQNQVATVESLKADPRLINPSQIHEFPVQPTTALANLESLAPSVSSALQGNSEMMQLTSSVYVGPEGDAVHVGATDVGRVSTFLHERFGSNAPISVEFEAKPINTASRYASDGPIIGGSALIGLGQSECTAGFGTRAPAGETRGRPDYKYFTLTAGHCYPMEEYVYRQTSGEAFGNLIGKVRRDAYKGTVYPTDAEAVYIAETLRSHSVLGKHDEKLEAQPVQGVQAPRDNEHVCWSGVYSGARCGKIMWHGESFDDEGRLKIIYHVRGLSIQGDSGGPVWDKDTHNALGLISGASEGHAGKCWKTSGGRIACNGLDFTPLLRSGGAAGVLPELGVEVLTSG